MNEYKKTKILKINLNKIGFISLQMNTKISRHDWKARILKKQFIKYANIYILYKNFK